MDEPSADIRIGTSGWTYPHWRHGAFYPEGLRQRDELAHLAGVMSTVEINGSFYSLQRPSSYRTWLETVPAGFEFAVKGGRFITHQKKLSNIEQPLATFFGSGLLALGGALGPVLWQLPAQLPFHPERIEKFLALLPRTHGAAAELAHDADRTRFDRWDTEPVTVTEHPELPMRHALEVRHPSYLTAEFLAICGSHGVAVVCADTAGRFPWIDQPVSDLGYFRLHGSRELYASNYTEVELDGWVERIRGWAAVPEVTQLRVYFDNDAQGFAPRNALALAAKLGVGPGDAQQRT
jgi:uncharacterized protein YecE (DUF72 family)